jgi:hypothetical protein
VEVLLKYSFTPDTAPISFEAPRTFFGFRVFPELWTSSEFRTFPSSGLPLKIL